MFAETGLLAGFFLPGDSLLVTAGLFAATGVLDLSTLLGLLTVAAIVGDTVGYWFGAKTGPRIFRREDSLFFHRRHLETTREFFEICAAHLADDGVLTLNSASVPGDRRLINGLATTMGTIFPSVYTMDIPGTLNTMIFATKQQTRPEDFAGNLVALSQDPNANPLLVSTMQVTFDNLKSGYETTTVFTDDHAPIEWIVNDMVIRFILEGGTQYLQ